MLLLPLGLAACAGGETGGGVSFTADRGMSDQPYPANYRSELLAFMRTYLNEPEVVKEAVLAEPVQRTVGGRLRYVACLRYATREREGPLRGGGDRAVVFVDGRLDRIIEKGGEVCAGATYVAFPELEKLRR